MHLLITNIITHYTPYTSRIKAAAVKICLEPIITPLIINILASEWRVQDPGFWVVYLIELDERIDE